MHRFKSRQSGISFIGVLFIVGALACLAILGAQAFPTVLEYQAALKAAQRASSGNSVPEVRQIFDNAAAIDDIKSIAGRDLEISKNGDQMLVKFAYTREIHMFGPAFLLLKYAGQSKMTR
jgi:hypothetical protein